MKVSVAAQCNSWPDGEINWFQVQRASSVPVGQVILWALDSIIFSLLFCFFFFYPRCLFPVLRGQGPLGLSGRLTLDLHEAMIEAMVAVWYSVSYTFIGEGGD